MLWDSVFEFFVKYVFGGYLGLEEYRGTIGSLYNISNSNWSTQGNTATFVINWANIDFLGASGQYRMPLGNYLSLIATIITMVIIVTLCALFIWKIIKLVGGLIR